jgi:hypothetical protein
MIIQNKYQWKLISTYLFSENGKKMENINYNLVINRL